MKTKKLIRKVLYQLLFVISILIVGYFTIAAVKGDVDLNRERCFAVTAVLGMILVVLMFLDNEE